jgi:molybdenum cofactor cytidylyltransferase
MQDMPPDHLSPELSVLPADEVTSRLVAIVPAAGLSRRMGQPKLLLDLAGRTVIARVIEALRDAGIARCLVVIRPSDAALIQEVTRAGGEVVLPVTDTADMRQSVEWGLRAVGSQKEVGSRESGVGRQYLPLSLSSTPCNGWLLVPADHPTLNPSLIRELIAAWSADPSHIAVPVHGGRRGHPTIFPWSLAEEVFRLRPDQGLNAVLRSDPARVREVCVSDPHILVDLDTPEDLLRLRAELERNSVG